MKFLEFIFNLRRSAFDEQIRIFTWIAERRHWGDAPPNARCTQRNRSKLCVGFDVSHRAVRMQSALGCPAYFLWRLLRDLMHCATTNNANPRMRLPISTFGCTTNSPSFRIRCRWNQVHELWNKLLDMHVTFDLFLRSWESTCEKLEVVQKLFKFSS